MSRGTTGAGTVLTAAVGTALITGSAMGNVGGTVMPVLLDGFGRRFHLSDSACGAVAAAQLLATAVAALLLSRRAMRPGRVRMARWGLVAAAAGLGAAAMAPDVAVLVAANVVAGAGLGAAFAAAAAAIAATRDSERASAVAVFGSTVVLAALLIAVPQANALWGGAAGFAVVAACCAPAWWLVRGLPEGAEPHPEHLPADAPPWWFLAAVTLLAVTDQGAWSYAGVLGERHAGLSSAAVSAVLAVAGLAALVGVTATAVAARRVGRVPTMLVVLVAEALAKLLVAACPHAPVYAAATVVWQVCYVGLLVQTLGVVTAADPSGRWAAAAAGALAIGTGIGPAAVGGVLEATGPTVLGLTLAAATGVAAVPLLRTARHVGAAGGQMVEPQPGVGEPAPAVAR
ncbi:MFS transporter [Yinghuangia seranimata]|uniref:MFS transporter n=1 Tax=Yinghuangia seranimata TaxID=408067 RepID=UPI00248CA3C5|nr:MFS transporter [Yinghuangia seranimata]MDI2124984.1 MFS transporter [Yinghuangia seranimata]